MGQQHSHRRPTAYPQDEKHKPKRAETPQRPRSAARRPINPNPSKRRTPMDYSHHHEPEDTYTDKEELNCITRTDNMTESEVQQLPVRMPRFGFGDYLSQQSCFRNLPTVQNSNSKYMVAHIRQILETRTKEPLSEDEWIEVLGRHRISENHLSHFSHFILTLTSTIA